MAVFDFETGIVRLAGVSLEERVATQLHMAAVEGIENEHRLRTPEQEELAKQRKKIELQQAESARREAAARIGHTPVAEFAHLDESTQAVLTNMRAQDAAADETKWRALMKAS